MALQPLISCPSVSGTASCRCVRPILTTSRYSALRRSSVAVRRPMAGRTCSSSATRAATCMAVGNVSFELCEQLTWSFGCTSVSPSSSLARWAMTSLTFIFVCVPLPVCQTASGKLPSSEPSRISWQAVSIAPARRASSTPSCAFARAAAHLAHRIMLQTVFHPVTSFRKNLRCRYYTPICPRTATPETRKNSAVRLDGAVFYQPARRSTQRLWICPARVS